MSRSHQFQMSQSLPTQLLGDGAQMWSTCRSKWNGMRHDWPLPLPLPLPVLTVAVRWLMRTTVPTWGCSYLSSNETFSPPRKSLREALSGGGFAGAACAIGCAVASGDSTAA